MSSEAFLDFLPGSNLLENDFKNPTSNQIVKKKQLFAYAKTKAQISIFVFATLIV